MRTVQSFGEFQHIVCVAGLGTVDVIDIIDTVLRGREVFAARIAAQGQRTFLCHHLPEMLACPVHILIPVQFSDSLVTGHLRDLSVRVQIVKRVLAPLKRIQQHLVRVTACANEILCIPGHRICIRQDLVHTALLIPHHLLHLCVAQA